MPVYSYLCEKCNKSFELFFSYSQYTEHPKCLECGSKQTNRNLVLDANTISSSVKKSDSELKTIGDLANRNRDKLSDDEKKHLYDKHNAYKEEKSSKTLPKGMTRMKKGKKTKWT